MSRLTVSDEELELLEKHLAGTLRPVNPDPGFIGNLRKRLYVKPRSSPEQRRQAGALLLLAFGLLVGAALVLVQLPRVSRLFKKASSEEIRPGRAFS
ncbi:MAG TPA: hypothetical protein PKW33_01260 [Anaerolineaceae bacterium]|nr:hypothetical protein [Anaerolineaceae bacterium]HPN50185.1 hypothetical protein [Anaerolineaceae bacterium]